MITFGLTGGICSGKSNITRLFKENDIPMVDADIIARHVVAIGTVGYHTIQRTFGQYYFDRDGYLDRKKMANLIFSDDDARHQLDRIMIPLIRKRANQEIESFHKAGNAIVGFDSALIVEMGEADKYRPLVVVHCAPEVQIARMMRRNLLTHDEAVARLRSQLPREEKIKVADFVIDSSGTVEQTAQQALDIIQKIRTNYPR